MTSIISVKNLTFKYSNTEKPIFENISFDILKSSINLIIGSSGCGKSTLIKCLTGLIPNFIEGTISGQAFYQGENIIGKMPHDLCTEIGIVFQDPDSQFCTFTVEDEIAFGLENIKLSREEIDQRIVNVLSLIKITHLRKRILNTLSGGEKQKVAIASILALNPKCIILDEPTANLDPKSTLEIFETLKYLKEKENKTIVLIEHKVDDVIEFIDNIIIFDNQDKNVVTGTPEYIFNKIFNEHKTLPLWAPDTTHISKILKLKGICSNSFYKKEDAVKNITRVSTLFHNYSDNLYKSDNENSNVNLKIENLNFSYNRNDTLLKNINLEIHKGDFTALLGCNGAGKSTLTKIILGLYKNYTGNILINNKNFKKYKRQELNNKIGLVFQNPEHQFVANTVYDELAYSLIINGMDKKNIDIKVNEYMEKFNLQNHSNQNPYLLSQGQKRRLSVASMLITGQEILILDEPTFGQDRENTMELMEYMKKINFDGVTLLIITHDMNIVSSYCNKAIVLNKGEISYNGSVNKLFLNEAVLKDSKLEVPIINNISMKVKKVDDNFPILLNMESFIKLLNGV